MQFPTPSGDFIPLRSKYCPQHPVLKHPPVASLMSDMSFHTPQKNTGKIIYSIYNVDAIFLKAYAMTSLNYNGRT
jgi:hypothetical protein